MSRSRKRRRWPAGHPNIQTGRKVPALTVHAHDRLRYSGQWATVVAVRPWRARATAPLRVDLCVQFQETTTIALHYFADEMVEVIRS
jgi:hypothetical protein